MSPLPKFVVVALAALAVCGAASAAPCNVTLPSALNTGAGLDFVVPIDVTDATGALGMTFTFSYDASRVVATAVSSSAFTAGFALDANLGVPGLVQISQYGTVPLSGGGTAAWVRFHTRSDAAAGSFALHWQQAEVNEAAVTACDGQVGVVVPQVVVRSTTFCAVPGSDVTEPIVLDPGSGMVSLDLVLQYDPALLQPVGVVGTTLTSGFGVQYNVPVPGTLLVSLYGTIPIQSSGPVLSITWHVLGALGSVSPLHVANGEVNEGSLVAAYADGSVTGAADADGDGFTTCNDCSDANANVHPGAPELCDGIDNQCPGDPGYGQVDENVTLTFHRDADGDGYGDPHTSVTGCVPPAGYVSNGTDCNDLDASIHPGAVEIPADGIDENCDGFEICHVDADHDGYGAATTVLSANLLCTGVGESSNALDCDDARAAVHPGVAEVCNGIDDDCNGLLDDGNPGAGLRCGASNIGECATGLTACVAGAIQCAGEVTPLAETCDGRDNDCDGLADDACTTPSCNVRVPLESKVGPGEDFVVPITVGNATGASGLTFQLAYDASKLTAVAVYRAAATDGFALDANLSTPGSIVISLYGTVPISGGGAVAYVMFHAGAAGYGGTALHWISAELNEGAIPGTTCDGTVNVVPREMSLSVSDGCAAQGQSIVTPVSSASVSGLLGLDLTIEYDPAMLAPTAVSTTAFTTGFETSWYVTQPGRLAISLFGTTALTGGGTLVDVAWHVIGAAPTQTPIDLATVEVNEGAFLVTLDDGVVTIAPDADGDGFAACVDCNDANAHVYPGAPEICDGIDNQCPGDPGFGVIDDVAAPSGTPTVSASKTGGVIHLQWSGVAGASGYDVVRGLSAPVFVHGDFTSAVDACVANDLAAFAVDDATLPPAGEIYWYAVRAENCGGHGTWDAIPNDQVRSRDATINASPVACP